MKYLTFLSTLQCMKTIRVIIFYLKVITKLKIVYIVVNNGLKISRLLAVGGVFLFRVNMV